MNVEQLLEIRKLHGQWHQDWADLRTVSENYLAKNEAFFEEHGINWSQKGKYAIFNYRQDAEPNRYNGWCRALVLAEDGRVMSLPFPRFFNKGQKEAPELDPANCDLIEKMDGTLIGGFWDGDEFVFHTRRTISSHQPDMELEITNFNGKPYSLLQVAKKYVDQIKWDQYLLDRKFFCFAFELIHDATKVVTEYPEDKWGLYLLTVRNLRTMRDHDSGSEMILDGFAGEMGVRRPRVWTAESYAHVEQMMAEHPEDFEGYVLRDRTTGQRVKSKNPSYVERHHMVDRRTYRYLIPLWLKGERAEIEAYFPDTTPLFQDLEDALAVFTKKIEMLIMYWQGRWNVNNWTKKQLALEVIKHEPKPLHSYIFKLYDKMWDDNCVREWLKRKILDVRYIEEVLNVSNKPNVEDI